MPVVWLNAGLGIVVNAYCRCDEHLNPGSSAKKMTLYEWWASINQLKTLKRPFHPGRSDFCLWTVFKHCTTLSTAAEISGLHRVPTVV